MNTNSEFAKMISAMKKQDFSDWKGISENADYSIFSQEFSPLSESVGMSKLGTVGRELSYRMHNTCGTAFSMQVWFEGPGVVMIEEVFPSLRHGAVVLKESLGVPAAKYDYHMDIGKMPGGAHIYHGRGITLFWDSGETSIQKIALYTPCTLDYYREFLFYDDEWTELPE